MTLIFGSRETQTKDRIIAVADALFKQYGYQKTTVADIAKKLGMSPANVYRFFESKKDIVEAVALRLTGEVELACRKIANAPGPAAERLARLIFTIHEMSKERYTDDERMHEMVAVAMRDSWPMIRDHIGRVDLIIADIIGQGIESGEFKHADPHIAACCVRCATMRFSHPGLMIECADINVPNIGQMTEFVLGVLQR